MIATTNPAAASTLLRTIGVRGLTLSIINVTIGAGIFVLPALVGADLGRGAPYAYLTCALLMSLVALCVAAAGSRVSLTGGLYAYTETAFGPLVGSWSGVLYALTAVFATASIYTALVSSIAVAVPVVGTPIGRAATLAAIIGGLAVVNVRGVNTGLRLIEVVTIAKLLPLALLILGGIWFVRGDYLGWPVFPGSAALGRSAVLLIFAFAGLEVALVPSGEIVAPSRTVPVAIFSALLITTVIYLAVQAVVQGLLGPALADYAAAPLAEAAGRTMGTVGRVVVLAGATVSMSGFVSGDMLGSPRNLFALARAGLLPSAFSRVHERFRTPHVAVVGHALVVFALALSGSFVGLAVVANVSGASLYLLCVAASYVLQRRDVRGTGEPFVLPLGPLIPVLAAGVIVWLLAHASWQAFAVEAAVLTGATAVLLGRRFFVRP